MAIDLIVTAFTGLAVAEKRAQTDRYVELVFFTRDTDSWIQALSQHLGPPLKPPGTAPSDQHRELSKSHGGVAANQTLFHRDGTEGSIIAMFWPWQDGQRTTLKLARLR